MKESMPIIIGGEDPMEHSTTPIKLEVSNFLDLDDLEPLNSKDSETPSNIASDAASSDSSAPNTPTNAVENGKTEEITKPALNIDECDCTLCNRGMPKPFVENPPTREVMCRTALQCLSDKYDKELFHHQDIFEFVKSHWPLLSFKPLSSGLKNTIYIALKSKKDIFKHSPPGLYGLIEPFDPYISTSRKRKLSESTSSFERENRKRKFFKPEEKKMLEDLYVALGSAPISINNEKLVELSRAIDWEPRSVQQWLTRRRRKKNKNKNEPLDPKTEEKVVINKESSNQFAGSASSDDEFEDIDDEEEATVEAHHEVVDSSPVFVVKKKDEAEELRKKLEAKELALEEMEKKYNQVVEENTRLKKELAQLGKQTPTKSKEVKLFGKVISITET